MHDRLQRSLLIDGLKGVAAVLIVLHHLAFYGPMADQVRPLLPRLWGWLADDARMAVQVFLVIGGYLAARSLAPLGRPDVMSLLPTLRNRFLRLAPPYYVILLLAVACNELARSWMTHESISAPASPGQLIAHALLLHDLLGYQALSAGLWYVAIDMQLFMLMAALLWIGNGADKSARKIHAGWGLNSTFLLVSLLGLASLLYFNRDYAWDTWVVYFFGIYALGALAWWASCHPRAWWWLAAMSACTAAALLLEFRPRLLLALLVALMLGASALWRRRRAQSARPKAGVAVALSDAIHGFAAISYPLFLVHFPVCLVVNAFFTRFTPPIASWQTLGLAVALALSIAAGAMLHVIVERPLQNRLRRVAVSVIPRPSPLR